MQRNFARYWKQTSPLSLIAKTTKLGTVSYSFLNFLETYGVFGNIRECIHIMYALKGHNDVPKNTVMCS